MENSQILNYFAKYIEKELGIVYAEHNYFQLQNRLEEISKFLAVDSIEKLYTQAQTGITGQFQQLLLDIATNNETSFFRDNNVFRAIEGLLLGAITTSNMIPPKLNIWSAASSSGQEALSVAMLILEWSKKSGKNIDFKITGTDISTRILEKAKKAKYTQLEVQRGLPAPLMIKYFIKDENDGWSAKAELTNHIDYKPLNLLENYSFPTRFDVVLCRNVLIYQNVARKIEILNKIYDTLNPDGVLILGSGESLIGLSEDFSQVSAEGAVIYKKKERNKKAA